jgi:uncharacterized protein (UPF0332 family)
LKHADERGESCPSEGAPLDPSGQVLWNQAWEFWIAPEVEARRKSGRLQSGFELRAVQVIFDPETASPDVRLNEEVRAVSQVKVEGPIEKGQAIFVDQVQGITSIELTDHDPEAGHFTALRLTDYWYIAFDFRRYATRVGDMVARAQEYLSVAGDALRGGALAAFVDNLYSAMELLAKAELVLSAGHDPHTRSHRTIRAQFNRWGHLGNVDAEHVRLLNELGSLRPKARYLEAALDLDASDAAHMLTVAEVFIENLKGQIPERHSAEPM